MFMYTRAAAPPASIRKALTMPHRPRGRRRALDCNKKNLIRDAVARGATLGQAAIGVGVSLRTVQREARLDPHFDHSLRTAQTVTPDPLSVMRSASRTNWRAAAWLLERTQPAEYGRRPACSCTPGQFNEALRVIIDAALALLPHEAHAAAYAHLVAASDTAFKAIFPNYGPWGRPLVQRLPATPLADAQELAIHRNLPPHLIVPDYNEPAGQHVDDGPPDPADAPLLNSVQPVDRAEPVAAVEPVESAPQRAAAAVGIKDGPVAPRLDHRCQQPPSPAPPARVFQLPPNPPQLGDGLLALPVRGAPVPPPVGRGDRVDRRRGVVVVEPGVDARRLIRAHILDASSERIVNALSIGDAGKAHDGKEKNGSHGITSRYERMHRMSRPTLGAE